MAVMTITQTTIGKKVLMAVTGLVWIGFLFFHMFGNTKAFYGAEYFNHYAEALREFGAPVLAHGQFLFLFRVLTITALTVHIWMAVSLTRRNLASRGSRYAVHKKVHADAASLTMRYGGIAIALFILFHLAQFTWGVKAVLPSYQQGMPYENMIAGFSSLPVMLLYLVALVFVGLHLYHGTWSMFQTLGLNNARSTSGLHGFALALAVIIAGGFALVPLAVTFGILS